MEWKHSIERIAPLILALTPLAPFSPAIILGINEAESLIGAKHGQKLEHVVNKITAIAPSTIHPNVIRESVSTIIDVVNIFHKSEQVKLEPRASQSDD